MERMIDAETEELSKREKYRERRGEEYDVVSKSSSKIIDGSKTY